MRAAPARIMMLVLSLAILLLVTACGGMGTVSWDNLPPGAYPPDGVFEDFYLKQGGYDVFGYAISTSYTLQNGQRLQYYETVLMRYDPASDEISFEPLGLEMGLDHLPSLPWVGGQADDGLIVGSFHIHPKFVPLFLSLGPDLAGLPITQPFFNPGRNRVEQHFENLGMFYPLGDETQTASLLDYGLVQCGDCGPQSDLRKTNAIIQEPLIETFFYEQMALQQISPSASGEMLAKPLVVADGSTELVMEYMAVSVRDGVLSILPLPRLLGLADSQFYLPSSHPALVFIEIENGVGYNVLRQFDTFIQQNGGYRVSGAPITGLLEINPQFNHIRQCFENYCLDYLPDLPDHRVRPLRLGEKYLAQVLDDRDLIEQDELNNNQVQRQINPFTLLVWEYPTVVDSQTPETISVMVALGNTPQPGLTVMLTVKYPDGTEAEIVMPPTQENGTTSFTHSPVQGENGDLVIYQACLLVQGETQLCVEQNFMIWGNP